MPLTKSQAELLDPSSSGATLLGKHEIAAAYALIGRAFSGTSEALPEPGTNWIAGPGAVFGTHRDELFHFMMGVYLRAEHNARWSRSGVLAVRAPDGGLQAVAFVHRMSSGRKPNGLVSAWRFTRAVVAQVAASRMPSVFTAKDPATKAHAKQLGRSLKARGTLYGDEIARMHALQAQPHWYVAALAVDPSAQGQGLGKRLLGALGQVADVDGLDVYLDCGSERHCRIYERCGYEVCSEGLAAASNVPGEAAGAWPERQPCYGMVRRPKLRAI